MRATRLWAAIVGGLLVLGGGMASSGAQTTQSVSSADARVLLNRYCVSCHSDRLKTGGLSLEHASLDAINRDAELWEKVVRKLRLGAMPPAGRPRPERSAVDGLAATLEDALDRAAAAASNPGRPGVHRLNRTEYTNVIRDLLDLEIDGRSLLPGDDAMHGFDNIADMLAVSQGLLERYLTAARRVSRLALGDPTIAPTEETFDISKTIEQTDRGSDDLPFGTRGGVAVGYNFPVDGEYSVRVFLHRSTAVYESTYGLHESNQIEVSLDGKLVKLFEIPAQPVVLNAAGPSSFESTNADKGLVVAFPARAGRHTVGAALVNTTRALEGLELKDIPPGDSALSNIKEPMSIRRVAIRGPLKVTGRGETASRRRIFTCYPSRQEDEVACARTILGALARRAYRRPETDQDLETLVRFFRSGRDESGFEGGIERALERILADPDFLFRFEYDPPNVQPGQAYAIGALELASRLSFFLWSSIPDDELLGLASSGRLKEPAVLEQQVRRMLADPRSSTLVTSFASQWLWQRNLRTLAIDAYVFPQFDDSLREAFEQETRLFLESQLREDKSVRDLLTANYTFVNERLARHYGMPNVYGRHFRRVVYPDSTRAGLLGHGSILAVTSYSTRTSPVIRGKWILENFFGAPPPAPPPNVPTLDESTGTAPASMRERMARHRKNAVCASCHTVMDPIGLSLENFDAVGLWRTTDSGVAIDASGAMPDGATYQGAAGLRRALLERQGVFISTVTEKLLTYALGRGIEFYDRPAVRRIIREAAAEDYRWSAIVLGIAGSAPFQMRTGRPVGSVSAVASHDGNPPTSDPAVARHR